MVYDASYIFISFLSKILHKSVFLYRYGEVSIQLGYDDELRYLLAFLRRSSIFRFVLLTDLFATDYLLCYFPNIELTYVLTSFLYNVRLRVKNYVSNFVTLSIEQIFSDSVWLEREVWDMYGIVFLENTDLRRILTDYGFKGHPMRKDFPLSGFFEIRFNEILKRIVMEPIEFSQKYRYFTFKNPWI